MATGFGVAKLSAYIHHATMTTKSVSCTSRRYFKSASSFSNHGIIWPALTAPSVCVPLKTLHQGYILSKSFTDQAKTINSQNVTKNEDTKTYTAELDRKLEGNITKHNNVIPRSSSSSPALKTSTNSVSSCPILCPMCHGHIGYRCDDKSLNELMSLQSRCIKIEPKFQVRNTETRAEEINTESKLKNVEYNTVIPKPRQRSPLPIRTSCSSTNPSRLIVCPMCHKNIIHGSRNTEKRAYRVIPLITSQVRVFDFVAEVKDTPGIKAALDAVRAAYNKVIPKCPKTGCPSPPNPPPCPCCPTCPPCCPSCPPCSPSCPCEPCPPCEPCQPCPPCQPFCPRCPPCPSCTSGSSNSKCPTGSGIICDEKSGNNLIPLCTVPAQNTDLAKPKLEIIPEEINTDSKLESDENNQALKHQEKSDPTDVTLRDRVQRVRNKATLLNIRQRSRVCNFNIRSLSKNRRREALSKRKLDP